MAPMVTLAWEARAFRPGGRRRGRLTRRRRCAARRPRGGRRDDRGAGGRARRGRDRRRPSTSSPSARTTCCRTRWPPTAPNPAWPTCSTRVRPRCGGWSSRWRSASGDGPPWPCAASWRPSRNSPTRLVGLGRHRAVHGPGRDPCGEAAPAHALTLRVQPSRCVTAPLAWITFVPELLGYRRLNRAGSAQTRSSERDHPAAGTPGAARLLTPRPADTGPQLGRVPDVGAAG